MLWWFEYLSKKGKAKKQGEGYEEKYRNDLRFRYGRI
jgi:hypothetical protein